VTESLQDRRRRYIGADISQTAMRLFAERGFDHVTVEDIAAAAGISSRTFFRYFATKDEVVLRYEHRLRERLEQALAERPDDEGPVTALRNAYLVTSTTAPEDRESVAMQSKVLSLAPSLRNRAHGERTFDLGPLVVLVAHRMRVDPERDPRPETIVAAMSGAASAAYQRWVDHGGRGNPADEIGAALRLVEDGLAALDHSRARPARPAR
jgi:AcrR family transcriptional regulator